MSTSAYAPLETEVPVFDVIVSLATGATADTVEKLARQFGDLSSAQIDGFIRALRNNPRVKIGDHIPQERVDVAREQFTKLGLTVNVVPVLSLQTKSDLDADGRFLCRACNNRVELPLPFDLKLSECFSCFCYNICTSFVEDRFHGNCLP